MIMVCQGRNIPLSFSSVELLFSTKSICVAIVLCLSTLSSRAEAGEYFNPNLLEVAEEPAASVDLSYFSQDGVPPGTYHLDVYINDKYVSSESLTFQEIGHDAGATASPCLSAEYLNSWLINTTAYPQLFAAGGNPCPADGDPRDDIFGVSCPTANRFYRAAGRDAESPKRLYTGEPVAAGDQRRSSQL